MIPTPNPAFSSDDFRMYFGAAYLNWAEDGVYKPAYVRGVEDETVSLWLYDSPTSEPRSVRYSVEDINARGWEVFSWPAVGYTSPIDNVLVEVSKGHQRTAHKGIQKETSYWKIINNEELFFLGLKNPSLSESVRKFTQSMDPFHTSILSLWFQKPVSLEAGLDRIFGDGICAGVVLSPDACLVLSVDADSSEFPVMLLYNGALVRKYRSPRDYVTHGPIPDTLISELLG